MVGDGKWEMLRDAMKGRESELMEKQIRAWKKGKRSLLTVRRAGEKVCKSSKEKPE